MGNTQGSQELDREVYLSDVQQWGNEDLMFQSKLSSVAYDTRLNKKTVTYTSASENIANYLQKYRKTHADSTSSDSTSKATT